MDWGFVARGILIFRTPSSVAPITGWGCKAGRGMPKRSYKINASRLGISCSVLLALYDYTILGTLACEKITECRTEN